MLENKASLKRWIFRICKSIEDDFHLNIYLLCLMNGSLDASRSFDLIRNFDVKLFTFYLFDSNKQGRSRPDYKRSFLHSIDELSRLPVGDLSSRDSWIVATPRVDMFDNRGTPFYLFKVRPEIPRDPRFDPLTHYAKNDTY